MALTTAFAKNGNRKAVPQSTADGSVSYEQGFGNLYALPPEEGGLFIDRAQFNQIMYDTTSAVISNQNSINTLNSKVTANQNSINTLNSKVADLESGVSTGVVNLTGNQTIAGVKTFSAPPVSAINPTANNQVANKAYVDTVANAKANANATVNLTGNQSIAGAKTFTSNITAPNITTMQNSINTINQKITTLEQPRNLTLGDISSGAQFQTLDAALAEAAKYFGNKSVTITLLSDITINKRYNISLISGMIYFVSNDNTKHTINFDTGAQLNFWDGHFLCNKINFKTTQPDITMVRVLNTAVGAFQDCSFDGAATAIVCRSSFLEIINNIFTNISTQCIDNYRGGITNCSHTIINSNVNSMVWQHRGGITSINYTTINTPFTGATYNIAANTMTQNGIIFENN